ncbi:MAG: START domain-containing protein [Myxococcaceae bacterium]
MISLISLMILAASPDTGPGWEQSAREDGITVFSREKAGTPVREMKAIGLIDADPQAVWKALRDYAHYDKTMPYTEESKVLEAESDGKVIYFYSVVNAPLVSRRDYVIKLVDESDGSGTLLVTWSAVDGKMPEKDGRVRVKINDGFWRLEPRENGKKTFATYYVYTDPGGAVPKWIINKANKGAVPDVFRALRKATAGK